MPVVESLLQALPYHSQPSAQAASVLSSPWQLVGTSANSTSALLLGSAVKKNSTHACHDSMPSSPQKAKSSIMYHE